MLILSVFIVVGLAHTPESSEGADCTEPMVVNNYMM